MMEYELKLFEPESATNEQFKTRLEFLNIILVEMYPDYPPVSLESSIKSIKSWQVHKDISFELWNIWIDNKIVAELFTIVTHREDNQHLLDFKLRVLANYRRRGLGSLLLQKAMEIAKEHRRTLLISFTIDKVPAGAEFAKKFGAEMCLAEHVNRLTLVNLDRGLMKSWQDKNAARTREFEMGFWSGEYPENEIEDIAKMMAVMNTAPTDNLDIEDFKITPEQLRQGEESLRITATERWTYFVRHKQSGQLAGYTETFWDLDNPKTVYQSGTGVLPEYRGHALGKWLKAAMVEKILKLRPDVEYIQTGNADSNVHMLAINKAMGFEPYIAEQVWQIRLEKLEEYFSKQ